MSKVKDKEKIFVNVGSLIAAFAAVFSLNKILVDGSLRISDSIISVILFAAFFAVIKYAIEKCRGVLYRCRIERTSSYCTYCSFMGANLSWQDAVRFLWRRDGSVFYCADAHYGVNFCICDLYAEEVELPEDHQSVQPSFLYVCPSTFSTCDQCDEGRPFFGIFHTCCSFSSGFGLYLQYLRWRHSGIMGFMHFLFVSLLSYGQPESIGRERQPCACAAY